MKRKIGHNSDQSVLALWKKLEDAKELILKSVSNSLEARNSNKEDNFKLNQRSRCLSISAVSKIDHAIKEFKNEK